MISKGTIERTIVREYLSMLDVTNLPSPEAMESEILLKIGQAFEIECSMMSSRQKWIKPQALSPQHIADIILYTCDVKCVSCVGAEADKKYDMLAIYQTSGPDEGLYVEAEGDLWAIASEYNYNMSSKESEELFKILKRDATRISRYEDPDLIAVNNGIFEYKTKQLLPFSPEYVFMTKSRVNYNPNAQNITIHNDDDGTDWDIEEWMKSVSDDPEIVNLLWQLIGAIIRPYVRWNKSAWLYSATGNNGKGTLCELMRNLCGKESHTAIEIAEFGKPFALESLINKLAIITDENDVSMFLDKVAKLKAVITGDPVPVDRKFKTNIAYAFRGLMVQCVNGIPKVKDKTGSLYRRLLVIPFDKCFTGVERQYVKTKYIKNQAVLEYVLHKVLHMDYYELSEPEASKKALAEYKKDNDPVRQFWDEFEDQFVWDLLPFTFLYDLYKEWFKKVNPSGSIQGYRSFTTDLLNIIKEYDKWYCENRNKDIRTKNMMNAEELLIFQYDLIAWKNPGYKGTDPRIISKPNLNDKYTGILRSGSVTGDDDDK